MALRARLDRVVSDCLTAGAENIYLPWYWRRGHSDAAAAQLLQRCSRFPAFIDMPAELILTGSANLTSKSIIVMPSFLSARPRKASHCSPR